MWCTGRECRRFWLLIGAISVLTSCSALRGPLGPINSAVYFSPDGGGTEAIVRAINAAQYRIWVQAYSFTSVPIAEALITAHKRGVEVVAVLDKSNQSDKYTAATFLHNAGIKTLIDDQHAIAHNKVMLIDDQMVITGSFNFTKAAEERNAENLLILNDDIHLAGAYADNIVLHAGHSQPYQFLGEATEPPVASQEPRQRQTRGTTKTASRVQRKAPRVQEASITPAIKRKPAAKPVQVASARATSVAQAVRANRRSKVYRTVGCPGYDLINPDNQVVFASEQKAIAAGYRKAEACQ